MLRLIFMISSLLAVDILAAQAPVISRAATEKARAPVTVAGKPDLVITAAEFVRGEKNLLTHRYYYYVELTIQNKGFGPSGYFDLGGYYHQAATSGAGRVWTLISSPGVEKGVGAGQTITQTFVFSRPLAEMGAGHYSEELKIKADLGNKIRELDETNNSSAVFIADVNME